MDAPRRPAGPDARFSSRSVEELPADSVRGPAIRQVQHACYSLVEPTPVPAPRLIAHSREMTSQLGYSEDDVELPGFAAVFGGNRLEPGMTPHAACYGGHQFGSWAGQLGDGRAISLGETRGRDGNLWELQLKGAGPTPYSRRADGRAVLRSSVREFLCSEAMHHLGVPTTRALSLVLTGDQVLRDMFYDGRAEHEPGAVVCRVAPSFLRFGSFEIFASRQDLDTLRQLAAFSLRHFFVDLVPPGAPQGAASIATPDAVTAMFARVCQSTAKMITEWMRVGFVHGVMNTDNMSLLGLTIDYGPYGWLEDFDPNWTPNTTDASGRRYRYGNQPRVGEWNLRQLGNALLPLVGEAAPLEEALEGYSVAIAQLQGEMMARKLGLRHLHLEAPSEAGGPPEDRLLVSELQDALQLTETDMTIFYRELEKLPLSLESGRSEAEGGMAMDRLRAPLEGAFYAPSELSGSEEGRDRARQLDEWLRKYARRCLRDLEAGASHEERSERMNSANPKYVLRNYLAQVAIDAAAAGDYSEIAALLDVLRRPYDEQPALSQYAEKRPEWARHRAGCSTLSCSS